jgi:hypothetical protein
MEEQILHCTAVLASIFCPKSNNSLALARPMVSNSVAEDANSGTFYVRCTYLGWVTNKQTNKQINKSKNQKKKSA